jgi:hypothetical protein
MRRRDAGAQNQAPWASIGTCVDVFAPGVNITSAWGSGDTATNTISGTSMATPHVAGVVARLVHGRRHDQRWDDRLQGLRVQHDRLFEHGLGHVLSGTQPSDGAGPYNRGQRR